MERMENQESNSESPKDGKQREKSKKQEKKIEEDADKEERKMEDDEELLESEDKQMEATVEVPTKEDFTSFDHTAEVLRKGWRHKPLPQPLQPYYGPIRGFNCGEYSEFQFSNFVPPCLEYGKCNSKWIEPPDCPSDYIFPGKIAYKGEVPLTPYFLNHEKDVVNKRIEADLKRPDGHRRLKALEADFFERPQYMYHRGDSTWSPRLNAEDRYRQKSAF